MDSNYPLALDIFPIRFFSNQSRKWDSLWFFIFVFVSPSRTNTILVSLVLPLALVVVAFLWISSLSHHQSFFLFVTRTSFLRYLDGVAMHVVLLGIIWCLAPYPTKLVSRNKFKGFWDLTNVSSIINFTRDCNTRYTIAPLAPELGSY